jgi:F0F1-type ATP synthase epsilon subunit
MALTEGGTYQAAQTASGGKKADRRFLVKLFSPYQTFYEGEAVSLSAANGTGPFDVLPGHINFFSLLSGGTVIINTGFQRLEFPIAGGILRVSHDRLTLFCDV